MPNTNGGFSTAVLSVGLAMAIGSGAHLFAQMAPIPFVDSAPMTPAVSAVRSEVVGVEVLSDTQGVDFDSYTRRVIQTISPDFHAAKIAPGADAAPATLLTLVIGHEGKLIGLHLDESSSNQDLDRAAWASVSQHKSLPSLPKNFVGSSLTLRVRIQAS